MWKRVEKCKKKMYLLIYLKENEYINTCINSKKSASTIHIIIIFLQFYLGTLDSVNIKHSVVTTKQYTELVSLISINKL